MNRADKSGFANWWFTVDRVALLCMLVLAGIGLMLAFAASPAITGGPQTAGDFRYSARQVTFACGAIAILCSVSLLNLRQIRILAAVTFACALIGSDLVRLSAVFRFLPADWLPRLERASEWQRIFQPGPTLWVNPGSTILTQSKRFPLVWPELHARLATWKSLLPETRSPRRAFGEHWVLKPALAHEGYRVGMPGITDERDYLRIRLESRLMASRWVAQRRFHAAAIATPDGPRFPCVGSYVVNGRPAGLYGRLAVKPVIDDKAQDVVVLVRQER